MLKQSIVIAAIVAGGIGLPSTGAQAMTFLSPPSSIVDGGSYQPAAYAQPRQMRYNPAIHGNRCRQRLGGCVHYYNGYYYERTWWTVGLPAGGTGIWVYDFRRHGQRYHHRMNGFGYYYGGYYYARPWWAMAPGLSIRIN